MFLRLVGELDAFTAPPIRRQVEVAASEGEPDLVLDMEHVTFADAAALSIIVAARRAHMRVTIIRPSRAVMRVLDITGLTAEVTTER